MSADSAAAAKAPAPGSPGPSAGSSDEKWWWSLAAVVVAGLLVVVAVAVAAMLLDSKDAGTIAGAAFTAVGTLVTAFLGLKTTQNQATSAAVFAAHVPESQARVAIERAMEMRRQSA
jgi:uncharacterized membrane protein YebE (DUF533 family)